MDRAVRAAQAAFGTWSQLSPADRAGYLDRLCEHLDRQREHIARTVTSELGTPRPVSVDVQAGLPLTVLRSYVDLAQTFQFTEQVGNSLVVKEPVGVVGAITPWNDPLHLGAARRRTPRGPASSSERTLVRVAGPRWRGEESFQTGKGLTGLDLHEVRLWTGNTPKPWRHRLNGSCSVDLGLQLCMLPRQLPIRAARSRGQGWP